MHSFTHRKYPNSTSVKVKYTEKITPNLAIKTFQSSASPG